jgi:hypothetical protein
MKGFFLNCLARLAFNHDPPDHMILLELPGLQVWVTRAQFCLAILRPWVQAPVQWGKKRKKERKKKKDESRKIGRTNGKS